MALLMVENIEKSFGGTEVLRGISFSLEAGQVLAIIGSSGSGKTTLLRCLNFLEQPDAGRIVMVIKTCLPGISLRSSCGKTASTLVLYSRILTSSPSTMCFRM